MKTKLLILIFNILTVVLPLEAQKVEAHRGEVTHGYNFWLYTPKETADSDSIGKPIVIFLHGASLCGTDLNKVRRYGTIDAIDMGRHLDAYVVAPQNPRGAWDPKRIMNVVDWVREHHDVDSTRIYALGMSLGGYGTLDLAAAYPDKIAAAMAMCGGSTNKNPVTLNEVPLWIIHGTADRAVAISQSDRVVEAMRRDDPETPRLIYNRVPGMNHSRPARLFYLQEVYDWLFSHRLTDEDRPVSEGFEINNDLLNRAYQGLNTSARTYRKKSGTRTRRRHR